MTGQIRRGGGSITTTHRFKQDPYTFNAMGHERKRIDFILVSGAVQALKTKVMAKQRQKLRSQPSQTTSSSDHWPVMTILCKGQC